MNAAAQVYLPENLLVNKRREKRAEEKSYYATRTVESGTRIALHIERQGEYNRE